MASSKNRDLNRSKKLTLPKSVLEMKFMKKTKERLEKEKNHDNLYADIITKEMRHASGNFIIEPSFIFCEDLLEGRMSFKGMNPEIEHLMDLENSKRNISDGEMDKDISDEILAKKFKALKRKIPDDSPSKYAVTKKKK